MRTLSALSLMAGSRGRVEAPTRSGAAEVTARDQPSARIGSSEVFDALPVRTPAAERHVPLASVLLGHTESGEASRAERLFGDAYRQLPTKAKASVDQAIDRAAQAVADYRDKRGALEAERAQHAFEKHLLAHVASRTSGRGADLARAALGLSVGVDELEQRFAQGAVLQAMERAAYVTHRAGLTELDEPTVKHLEKQIPREMRGAPKSGVAAFAREQLTQALSAEHPFKRGEAFLAAFDAASAQMTTREDAYEIAHEAMNTLADRQDGGWLADDTQGDRLPTTLRSVHEPTAEPRPHAPHHSGRYARFAHTPLRGYRERHA